MIEIRTKRCSHLRPLQLVELSYLLTEGDATSLGKERRSAIAAGGSCGFFVWELNPFFKMHNDPNMTGLEQQVDNDSNARES